MGGSPALQSVCSDRFVFQILSFQDSRILGCYKNENIAYVEMKQFISGFPNDSLEYSQKLSNLQRRKNAPHHYLSNPPPYTQRKVIAGR